MTSPQRALSVEVAMLPSHVSTVESRFVVVIDVLRAATSLSVMASQGVSEVIVAPNPVVTRQIASGIDGALTCGESDGRKPADFAYGNSPGDYRQPIIRQRPIVFCSSNGARALHLLAAAPLLLFGALVNARAVAETLLAHADAGHQEISLVCSGNAHGARVSLEDTFCAGLIIAHLQDLSADPLDLDDAANVALRLYRSYLPSNDSGQSRSPTEAALAMFAESSAARKLCSWGLEDDVQECARIDRIHEVMRATPEGDLLVARPLYRRPRV